MLNYLVILLDDISIPFCHASNPLHDKNLIPIDTLKEAIKWGMKENLMIHYVLPPYELPSQYYDLLESIDNIKIGHDILVFNGVPDFCKGENVVIRIALIEFINSVEKIGSLLPGIKNLNILYTDIESFTDSMISEYENALTKLSEYVKQEYLLDRFSKINILTNRLYLSKMNNCGAGISNITIAPNGKFYLCPSFYYDEIVGVDNGMNHKTKQTTRSVGCIKTGLNILNRQLLDLDHAPLCRICDSYHCNRCVWLNQKLTWDINTPSHQQCVISHIERNASKKLAEELSNMGFDLPHINEIQYLDPFDYKLNN